MSRFRARPMLASLSKYGYGEYLIYLQRAY
jgi:hypothetical protein